MSKRLATDPCRVEVCDRPLHEVTTRYKGKNHVRYDFLCAVHRTRWTRYRSFVLPGRRGIRKPDTEFRARYRLVRVNGKHYRRNRVVWSEAHGCPVPPGYHIHHIDGNCLNDAPENLQALPAREHNRMPHGVVRHE